MQSSKIIEKPRPPTPYERAVLGALQRPGAPLTLVPVEYRGETRYMLAMLREENGEEMVDLLAFCLNLEQDREHIVSLDGTKAQQRSESSRRRH